MWMMSSHLYPQSINKGFLLNVINDLIKKDTIFEGMMKQMKEKLVFTKCGDFPLSKESRKNLLQKRYYYSKECIKNKHININILCAKTFKNKKTLLQHKKNFTPVNFLQKLICCRNILFFVLS